MGLSLQNSDHGLKDEELDPVIHSEINITPLTDIFLVLLIIFMVTSSVMSQLGVDVDLPQASPVIAQAQPDGVVVTLVSMTQLKINGKPYLTSNWQEFEVELARQLKDTDKKLVILEGDRRAFLGSAIEVMDHAKKAGALEFAIATAPESSEE